LDLNGTGPLTESITAGVQFNLTGTTVSTGWVATGNGLLVMLPSDGQITSGAQLFGNDTSLPNGTTALNGFQALAQYDTNGSGIIDAADPIFSKLGVWVQTNADGTGTLKSLSDLGIVSLNLNAQASSTLDNGNVIGLTSTFTTADGQTHALDDVWFRTSAASATGITPTTTGAPATPVANVTTAADASAASLSAISTSQLSALTASEPKALRPVAGLQSAVSNLVQAMNSSIQGDLSDRGLLGDQQSTTSSPADLASDGPNTAMVSSLVSVMSQFDANGQLTSAAAPSSAATQAPTQTAVAKLKALEDPSAMGFLTTGKSAK
jgi:hypothetical protein